MQIQHLQQMELKLNNGKTRSTLSKYQNCPVHKQSALFYRIDLLHKMFIDWEINMKVIEIFFQCIIDVVLLLVKYRSSFTRPLGTQ